MAVDFAADLLTANYNKWARPITVTPVASAPAAAAYQMRGIFDTEALDLLGDDIVISSEKIILDIIEEEFIGSGHALPQQGDLINIPAEGTLRALGDFEVSSASSDGGGETTLELRKWEAPVP
jgi:hypothetical protein